MSEFWYYMTCQMAIVSLVLLLGKMLRNRNYENNRQKVSLEQEKVRARFLCPEGLMGIWGERKEK